VQAPAALGEAGREARGRHALLAPAVATTAPQAALKPVAPDYLHRDQRPEPPPSEVLNRPQHSARRTDRLWKSNLQDY